MPTYEYVCDDCNHNFEVFQNMTDEEIKKCPDCGGSVRRIISGGTGIIFKGSGFYINDYAKKERNAKSEKAPASKPSSAPACDKKVPCCGKEEPCSSAPCEN